MVSSMEVVQANRAMSRARWLGRGQMQIPKCSEFEAENAGFPKPESPFFRGFLGEPSLNYRGRYQECASHHKTKYHDEARTWWDSWTPLFIFYFHKPFSNTKTHPRQADHVISRGGFVKYLLSSGTSWSQRRYLDRSISLWLIPCRLKTSLMVYNWCIQPKQPQHNQENFRWGKLWYPAANKQVSIENGHGSGGSIYSTLEVAIFSGFQLSVFRFSAARVVSFILESSSPRSSRKTLCHFFWVKHWQAKHANRWRNPRKHPKRWPGLQCILDVVLMTKKCSNSWLTFEETRPCTALASAAAKKISGSNSHQSKRGHVQVSN